MARTILHSDCNGFYASVECLYRPEIRDKPVVVGGDVERRHGIVLAKNEIAKKYQIRTGETLWQARARCPGLVVVPPNFKRYLEFAALTRRIYNEYTDQVEPFGLDEAFLDVGGSAGLFGDGAAIADTIRARVKRELGITVSVGVSYNKIFSKLASDMKKPDATVVITQEDYRQKAWPLPASDLLCVGPATAARLKRCGITTIGGLARCDKSLLRRWFGKNGEMLWIYANGEDKSVVRKTGARSEEEIKSVGNSTTTPRDLQNEKDVKLTVMLLAESVASRLRRHKRLCRTVQLWLRDNRLNSFERQCKLETPSQLARELADAGMRLYRAHYGSLGCPGSSLPPLRSVGLRATDLMREEEYLQLSLFAEEQKRQAQMAIERTMDEIRGRFGHTAISRGIMLTDKTLSKTNPKDDHTATFPGNGFVSHGTTGQEGL